MRIKWNDKTKQMVEEIFSSNMDSEEVEDIFEKINYIREHKSLGEIEELDIEVDDEYKNKFDLTSTNITIKFICQNGVIMIFSGLLWKSINETLIIDLWNKKEDARILLNEEEHKELILPLEEIIIDCVDELKIICEDIIEEQEKENGIYSIRDLRIDINKYTKEEQETIMKTLELLGIK